MCLPMKSECNHTTGWKLSIGVEFDCQYNVSVSLEEHWERPSDKHWQRLANQSAARRMVITLDRWENTAASLERRAAERVISDRLNAETEWMRQRYVDGTGITPDMRHELRSVLTQISESGDADVQAVIQRLRADLRYGLSSGTEGWTSASMTAGD